MTQDEILKNNILIANFDDPTWKERVDLTWKDIEEYVPSYDKFWDYLFPVFEKIESLGFSSEIYCIDGFEHRTQFFSGGVCLFKSIMFKSKINSVYFSVIEFIKWYNQNKKL